MSRMVEDVILIEIFTYNGIFLSRNDNYSDIVEKIAKIFFTSDFLQYLVDLHLRYRYFNFNYRYKGISIIK